MLAKFGIRNIKRNQRRTVVALGTIGVGVFGLLLIQGFFTGLLYTHSQNSIHSRHGHGQITTKGYWDQPFEKPINHWLTNPSALLKELKADPRVEHVFPRVQFFALLSNGNTHVAGRGQGVLGPEESVFFNQMNFVAGGPIGTRKDGLVLGQGLAKALNAKIGDSLTVLGQTVHGTLNGIDTTVTGIFNVGFKEADDMLFQIQLDQAQLLLESDKIESMVLGLKQENDWQGFSQDFADKYPMLEALSVYQIDFVWAENGRLFLTALMNLFRGIFLGVILLAIYNSASNTILERKRELGMLRANGESKASVIGLLVIEGATIASLGVLLGVVLAFMVNFLIPGGIIMPPTPGTNRALAIPLHFEMSAVVLAMLTGALTAILATLLSALQVLKLPIATALKS